MDEGSGSSNGEGGEDDSVPGGRGIGSQDFLKCIQGAKQQPLILDQRGFGPPPLTLNHRPH